MGRNQHKPNPPLELIEGHVRHYWEMRLPITKILDLLVEEKHFDTTKYGLGIVRFRQMVRDMGLVSARTQKHTPASIRVHMERLRLKYPLAGVRDMTGHLFHDLGLKVAKPIVYNYFVTFENRLLKKRVAGKLQRKRWWSAGINDLWCVDQHDKWERFGLRLHTGIEPHSGKILWIQVWHNHHPTRIASYYFDTVERLGFMPLVTQSDLGSENYSLAKAHTALRHFHDPSLAGTLQHRWMRSKKNVKPEITWAQMRKRFTPGFEDQLEKGVTEGWYNADNPLHRLVFYWLFIPYLQAEVNAWIHKVNSSAKRHDKNKILPQGRPQLIFEHAHRFNTVDFKVVVSPEAVPLLRPQFAAEDAPAMELVPPGFHIIAQALYEQMGSPVMCWTNAWDVYRELLHLFEVTQMDDPALQARLRGEWHPDRPADIAARAAQAEPEPLDQPLHEGQPIDGGLQYMGGVAGGAGPPNEDEPDDEELMPVAMFSDEEMEDQEIVPGGSNDW